MVTPACLTNAPLFDRTEAFVVRRNGFVSFARSPVDEARRDAPGAKSRRPGERAHPVPKPCRAAPAVPRRGARKAAPERVATTEAPRGAIDDRIRVLSSAFASP
jgi:hypothetical protein